jgi:dihydroorotase
MALLLKNGRIVDPAANRDETGDLLVENGKIAQMAPEIPGGSAGMTVLDLAGKIVVPGLIDIHTHLREPGFDHKETIASGLAAAVAGGFTSIACMPNTSPVNDDPAVTAFILKQAAACALANVYPIAAISLKSQGTALAPFRDLRSAGAVGFSDDGKPVMNAALMRRALEGALPLEMPVIAHCEDMNLSGCGVMHEGTLSAELGLAGIPGISEEVMVARDLLLAEYTGAPLHICHVSTAGSVRLLREAKARGIKVTAETAAHYFTLTCEAVRTWGTLAKVNPPLRTREDVEAIRGGLHDGTIDAIASDHAPHAAADKEGGLDRAASGLTGLETSLAVSLSLVHEGVLTLPRLIEKMTILPARILRIPGGTLAVGADADITVIDPAREWTIDRTLLMSRGTNTPFHGRTVNGKAVLTMVGGRICFRDC